jgi:hypothetical protein
MLLPVTLAPIPRIGSNWPPIRQDDWAVVHGVIGGAIFAASACAHADILPQPYRRTVFHPCHGC